MAMSINELRTKRASLWEETKKFLAERDLHAETRYIPKKNINRVHGEWDQKIAIIGAGPAGLWQTGKERHGFR